MEDYDHVVFPALWDGACLTMALERRTGLLTVYDPCGASASARKKLGANWSKVRPSRDSADRQLRDICIDVFGVDKAHVTEDEKVRVYIVSEAPFYSADAASSNVPTTRLDTTLSRRPRGVRARRPRRRHGQSAPAAHGADYARSLDSRYPRAPPRPKRHAAAVVSLDIL